MPFHPFIAFEGPIASGKTTHADLLARKLGVRPIPEEFPENEFLADFYGDQTRWALPMQLSFLVLRTAQLRKIVHPLIEPVLVDYSYLKDPAFAQLLLKERELRLYQRISAEFQTTLAKHDLIVYLDAHNDVLLERIKRRNRSYEASIDSAYQDSLRTVYEAAFVANPELKVIRYDTSNLNLNSRGDVEQLQQAILNSVTE
ncbi:MAG: deoxynucleoside kinase [Candidatus Sulfotelmatobacter sp.]